MIDRLQSENIQKFIEDGPRLRYDYNQWVEGRDRSKGKVLIGGLGSMGVGRMWFDVREDHRQLPNFDDAPEIACLDGGPILGIE